MVDLTFVSTEVLLDEIFARIDIGIVCLMRVQEHGLECHGYTRRWHGNSHTCIGLCHDLADEILMDFHEREEGVEDRDE